MIRYYARSFNIHPIIMQYLFLNGFNDTEAISKFLYPSSKEFHDPFLLNDMKKAVERIIRAIKNCEPILIFGDYDADGITATSLLFNCLRKLGARVSYRLPLREEGYGIRPETIQELGDEISLIITVDNGSSAHEAIAEATNKGIEVIVTDHHDILSNHPKCLAFINPKRTDNLYPFPNLAGVGVAFKLVHALHLVSGDCWENEFNNYIELATLGTIGDLMPLTGENRVICKLGLRKFNCNPSAVFKNIFIKLFLKNIGSGSVGFQVVPLLNAIGRIGNPNFAVKILTQELVSDEAISTLIAFNKKRKLLTMEQYQECERIIEEQSLLNHNIIPVFGDFHHGLIGILASKIAEKYHKPAIVISSNGTGSCRSVEGTSFSIIDILNHCRKHLKRYGGHQAAAGFSIEPSRKNLENFFLDLQDVANQAEPLKSTKQYFRECPPHIFSSRLFDELQLLEPFGMEFSNPIFYARDVPIKHVEFFGHDEEHTKLISTNGDSYLLFNQKPPTHGREVSFYYSSPLSKKNEFIVHTI
ncbi:single-stranded-DNA-specific exonuclease RecJ [Bacillus sp. EB01]|uniref:single-stranded-DNA-specific exonuclease RecJ n=1 Tax=Bacillus sp. EB01 TaxID=1347086 RepID=UPI000B271F44|nr:single-stranded-DNA-specific exonuclease RecJ [Bacillus sp. EB01]